MISAPNGRMKKVTPKVAKVSNSDEDSLEAGKNRRAIVPAKKPKMTKSNHSRAFAIEAATMARQGADEACIVAVLTLIGPNLSVALWV